MLIVIAGREPCHKGISLRVSATHHWVAAFEQFARDDNSAQDRD
jgi:hypothetical protein